MAFKELFLAFKELLLTYSGGVVMNRIWFFDFTYLFLSRQSNTSHIALYILQIFEDYVIDRNQSGHFKESLIYTSKCREFKKRKEKKKLKTRHACICDQAVNTTICSSTQWDLYGSCSHLTALFHINGLFLLQSHCIN